MIRLENLTVSYRRHPAVHHVSGSFADGQATAIFGPNGAGKSTLLKAIMGALKPDAGRVLMRGVARRDMAYLPQQSEIDRSLPVSVIDLLDTGSNGLRSSPDALNGESAQLRTGFKALSFKQGFDLIGFTAQPNDQYSGKVGMHGITGQCTA